MTLMLIHGLGQPQAVWDPNKERLMVEANCLELSTLVKEKMIDYPMLYASFCRRIDDIALPIHLCGLSLGAILALHYTIDHPQKVASLILIAPQYKMPKTLLNVQNLIFHFLPPKAFF